MSTKTQKFYALDSSITGDPFAVKGPAIYPLPAGGPQSSGHPGAGGKLGVRSFALITRGNLSALFRGSQQLNFPGVMRAERAATVILTALAPGAITGLSTISFGPTSPDFAFWKTAGAPANPIDIRTAATAADVATAIAAALTVWTATQAGNPGFGFVSSRVGAKMWIRQASALPKRALGSRWIGLTLGDIANGPVVYSVPGDGWPALSLTGGMSRHAGVFAGMGDGVNRLWVAPGSYSPEIQIPG